VAESEACDGPDDEEIAERMGDHGAVHDRREGCGEREPGPVVSGETGSADIFTIY
jgi:hypothetical protein